MSDTTPGSGAQSGTDGLRRTAEEARDAATERLHEVGEQARDAAHEASEKTRERVTTEAERGKRRGAGELHRWAEALDRAAGELGGDSMPGRLVREASDGLDEMASRIEGKSVGEIVETVADFGRRHPTAFIGGAMLAGFAMARFATASRPRPEWDDDRDEPPYRSAPSPTTGPGPATTTGSTTAGGAAAGATAGVADPGPASGRFGTSPLGGTATGGGNEEPLRSMSAFGVGSEAGSPGSAAASRFGTERDKDDGSPGSASGKKDEPLTLTETMRESKDSSGTSSHMRDPASGATDAPGTASAPTGTDRPYPSAGPVPGRGDDDDKEDRK